MSREADKEVTKVDTSMERVDKATETGKEDSVNRDIEETSSKSLTTETELSNTDGIIPDKAANSNSDLSKDNRAEPKDNETSYTEAVSKGIDNDKAVAEDSKTSDKETDNSTEETERKLTNIEKYRQGLNKAEQSELARQGGIASGKARRERRTLGEHLKALLAVGDTQEEVCLALIEAARQGNYKAFNSLRDTIGEMPTVKQEVTASITEADKDLLDKVSKRLDITDK